MLLTLLVPLKDIDLHRDQKVCVRGFLHPVKGDEWLLSTNPQVKSCCLNKPNQIYLKGSFTKSDQPVSINGIVCYQDDKYWIIAPEQVQASKKNYFW